MRKFLIAMLVMASALAVAPFTGITASAGEKKTVFLDEQFKEDAFSTRKWKTEGASESFQLSCEEESGYVHFTHNVENYVLGTAEKISNLQSLQFDFSPAEAKWHALYFSATNEFTVKTDGSGTFDRSETFYSYEPQVFLQSPRPAVGANGSITSSGAKFTEPFGVTYNFEVGSWYTVKLEATSATTANLYCVLQGEEMVEPVTTITLTTDAYSFNDFYFFIGAEGGGSISMDNFQVVSDNVNFRENFNDTDINEGVAQYRTNEALKYTVVKANSFLSIENAVKGDGLFYNTPIPVEESVVSVLECLNASFNVSFANAKEDSLAFVFGVSESLKYEDGCYMCLMDSDSVSLNYYKNGELTALSEDITTRTLASKAGATVKVIANKDGTISVYTNDELIVDAKVDVENYYAGHLGFVAVKDNSGKIMIDALSVLTSKYLIPVTKSVTHNFSNSYFGNPGYEDFLIGSVPENALFVKDGKLVWEGASDYSYFGSAHQYDNFVMDFKICNILASESTDDRNATAKDRWLGFDIGKSMKTESVYGSNVMFAFQITPTADEVTFWAYTSADSAVDREELAKNTTEYKRMPASLFRDIQYDGIEKREEDVLAKDAVCVRLVAENGTLKLYMKKACELEYTLYYKIDGVETLGYTALCCTGFTYMKLDDFSMANISELYICADNYVPETIIQEGKETIIYDRGNTDMNGLKETELNKPASAFSCASYMSVSYCIMPLVLAGVLLLKKQKKDRDE